MADKVEAKKYRPGIPCSEESMKEHLAAFSEMDECFELLTKQQLSLLTKSKKNATIKQREQRRRNECENYSSTRKKRLTK